MGARITEQDFTRTYQPVITDLVSFYCQCELNAADALENRLMAERTVL